MELLPFTKAHNEFRERLQRFLAREVIPHVEQWEADHIVPRSAWKKMGEAGFLCTWAAPAYGGMGGDFLYSVIVAEEMLKTHHSGLITPLHSDIVVPYIESFGTEEQKNQYLPGCVSGDLIAAVAMTEPDAGSDLASMSTIAVEEGEEIVLNGSKTFISNGINCSFVIVAAKDPTVENPHQAIGLYIVEDGTPGFKKGQKLEKLGLHSQDTAELFFSDCRIPAQNRLGEKGAGFLLLVQKLQQERLMCAIMAQSVAEWVLNWTVERCKSRTLANGKPLSKLQANQFALAEMATEIRMSRRFLDSVIMNHMQGEDTIVESSMSKYWTSDMVKRITGRAMDIVGEDAARENCPVVRLFRDVQVMSIFAGTNEIMKGIIAKQMGL